MRRRAFSSSGVWPVAMGCWQFCCSYTIWQNISNGTGKHKWPAKGSLSHPRVDNDMSLMTYDLCNLNTQYVVSGTSHILIKNNKNTNVAWDHGSCLHCIITTIADGNMFAIIQAKMFPDKVVYSRYTYTLILILIHITFTSLPTLWLFPESNKDRKISLGLDMVGKIWKKYTIKQNMYVSNFKSSCF